jgi:nucleoid DNA-binding protein
MSENKTKPTDANVEDFLNAVEHPTRKKDGFELLKIMKAITKEKPVIWGPSIVGFGSYHYKYATGREGDMPRTGFSPQKSRLTVYIMRGLEDYGNLLEKLGKHKIGKSCLYINKLADVDIDVLKEIIMKSLEALN